MDDPEGYAYARQRVARIKGFYIHLTVYLLVNALLIAINLVTAHGVYWLYAPLVGWGIGLAAHAIAVFGFGGFLGRDWEERKIKELMARRQSRS